MKLVNQQENSRPTSMNADSAGGDLKIILMGRGDR